MHRHVAHFTSSTCLMDQGLIKTASFPQKLRVSGERESLWSSTEEQTSHESSSGLLF